MADKIDRRRTAAVNMNRCLNEILNLLAPSYGFAFR